MSGIPNFGTNIESDAEGVGIEPVIVREPPPKQKVAARSTETRIRIVLEDNENIPPTGQFFGLNGMTYMLKSNVEADVPIGIVNILNDAIMSVPSVDEVTKQVVGYKNRLRFPYRIIGTVPPVAA